jgi:parallel beta-helix repeat protein
VQLRGTTAAQVRGNLVLLQGTAVYVTGGTSVVIENNTIQQAGTGVFLDQTANPDVARNIVELCTVGIYCYFAANFAVSCNDIFNCQDPYAGDCPDKTGVDGNFSQDPEYCGVDGSGNYFLQSDSPCAPGNHPDGYACEFIGSHGVNCRDVPVERQTWGDIKVKYGR